MLESTGTLYRATIGRDSQQGVTQDPFVIIAEDVPCSVQSSSANTTMLYRQKNSDIIVTVYLDTDPQAQISDKFIVTDRQGKQRTLLVIGEAQQVDRDIVWVMYARQDPPPTKPTAVAFAVDAPDTVEAGFDFDFTVTAVDLVGNTVTDYTGTVQFFCFGDDLAVLPSPGTLTNGVGTFTVILNTLGTQNITAQDTTQFSLYGTSNDILVISTTGAGNFAGSEINFSGSEDQFAGAT